MMYVCMYVCITRRRCSASRRARCSAAVKGISESSAPLSLSESAPWLSESLAPSLSESALRAARWTVRVTARPRRRRSEAAASRRVRRSAAVEGIPATRPPSIDGYTSTTPKNDMDRNTPTQRHTHVPDRRVLQPAAARRMQERCRNKTTLLDQRVKFKRQQVNEPPGIKKTKRPLHSYY